MLANKIALVTGASRGIGKGIATELGRAGATVYITALERHREDAIVQKFADRLPTLFDTAKEINKFGGKAIPIFCDHGNDDEVQMLFERIAKEQNNRLDICVSNAFPAVTLMLKVKNSKFWEIPHTVYDAVNGAGLRGHYITCRHAAQLMVPQKSGLIVTTSSPGGLTYIFNVAYGINKAGADKMCADMAIELREHNVSCVSFWQCAVRSELFMNCGLIPEANITQLFKSGTSIEFPGKCVVGLATDKNILSKSGNIVTDMELAKEYNITDNDGSQPWCPVTSKYLNVLKQLNETRKNISLKT